MKLTDDGPVWVANVRLQGGTTIVTVPTQLADYLDLAAGDGVEISTDGSTVRIKTDAAAAEDPE